VTSRACCEDLMWPSLFQSTTCYPIYLISNFIILSSFLWPVLSIPIFTSDFMTKIVQKLMIYPIHAMVIPYPSHSRRFCSPNIVQCRVQIINSQQQSCDTSWKLLG